MPRQVLARRCLDARGLGELRQEVLIGLAGVAPHDAAQRGVGLERRRVDADRRALDQPGVRQPLQHPGEHRAMRLQIDQPTRARDRRVVRRRFVQVQVQEAPDAQRIGRAPGDRALRVEALEIPEQQQAKVPTRRETGSSHDLARRTSRTRLRRRRRTAPRPAPDSAVGRTDAPRCAANLASPPTSTLGAPPFAFAHRHPQSLVHGIDAVDPYSPTCTTGC